MINSNHLLVMTNYHLNGLFLCLAQKSKVPKAPWTERGNRVFTNSA